jgi:hypothetical protein
MGTFVKRYFAGLTLAVCALCATPAAATQYQVTVSGTLTRAQGEKGMINTGADPNLGVGTNFTLTASFDSSSLIQWGGNGYSIVGLYGLPTSGADYWRVDAGGMTWQSTDYINDFDPIYTYSNSTLSGPGSFLTEGNPAIIIQNGKVIGLTGDMLPSDSSARPELILGSTPGNGFDQYYNTGPGDPVQHSSFFAPASLSAGFRINAPDGLYGNIYNSQGFDGVWDFADSSVTGGLELANESIAAVPEPAVWAMMLLGFGGIGFRMRSSRRKQGAQLSRD